MRVISAGDSFDLGTTETTPTIGITDYSRRVTDDFGVTTVVERGFSRRMSVKMKLPEGEADAVQRRLADLRATSALWVADDEIAWLMVEGFYKDFEIDLNVPPISFCTLTLEGLAETETAPDLGGDPSPTGGPSTLQLLDPIAVDDAVLVDSSVAEDDAPAWDAGTGYAVGARVVRGHRVFESLAAVAAGVDPAASPASWLDTGPANRWAMFDQALGTVTEAAEQIVVTLAAGQYPALALLDVVGATVRAQAQRAEEPHYDQTVAVTGGAITFLDLPAVGGNVVVTIAGPGMVSVGTLLVGQLRGLGATEASPTAGITDFSRKVIDDFGEVTVVQRAWAKRMAARAVIRSDAVDMVANRIAAVRARPALWIGGAGLDSLTVYGFFKGFSIEVGPNVSKLSLSIEGLSKAAKVAPLGTGINWPEIADPDGTKPDDNATFGMTAEEAAEFLAAQNRIAAIASDAVLSAGSEKSQAILDWTANGDDFTALYARFEALGSPADIQPAAAQALSKVGALNAYLAGLDQGGLYPEWNDLAGNTPIVAATWRATWGEALGAVAVFRAAVTGRKGDPGIQGASAFTLLDIQYCSDPGPATVTKRGGGEAFNAKARTGEAGVAATVSGLLVPGGFIGLTTDPFANLSYETVDYAIHWSDDTGIFVWRNGVKGEGIGLRTAESAPVRATVRSDGKTVSYAVDGYAASPSHPINIDGEQVVGVFVLYHEGSAIEGITFSRDGVRGEDAPLLKTQWSIDGATNWHDHFFGADRYYRQSNDGGVTYGPAILGVGEEGAAGANGEFRNSVFRRSETVPEAPQNGTGTLPPGWSDGLPDGDGFGWQSVALFRAGVQLTNWSPPARITGEDGTAGETTVFIFTRSAEQPGTPASGLGRIPAGWGDSLWDAPSLGWQSSAIFRGDTQLTGWSTPIRFTGERGADGGVGNVSAGATTFDEGGGQPEITGIFLAGGATVLVRAYHGAAQFYHTSGVYPRSMNIDLFARKKGSGSWILFAQGSTELGYEDQDVNLFAEAYYFQGGEAGIYEFLATSELPTYNFITSDYFTVGIN